ncbi:MAG: hypothetical protein KFF73_20710 [Cyclobacteriaceae bacterium]|nr:hypothetical protein [Cyclobacteriaceae bacterium]
MNNIEISGIFHDIFLIIAYLTGVTSAILTGKKNNIHPSVTLILILMCTLSYIFFAEYFISHSGTWHQTLQSGFQHIDRTFGLAGIVFGLCLSSLLLRIPVTVLYKFSFPMLIIYAVSNLGCLGGHCTEVQTGFFDFQVLATFNAWQFLQNGLMADHFSIPIIFKSLGGFITVALIYQFRGKFKNPRNISMLVFSAVLWMSFINLFFAFGSSASFMSDRLLGMNLFQWAILMINSLLMMFVFANESATKKRFPKLKIKQPPNYMIFSIYLVIFFIAFRDSWFLSDSNLQIFTIGFSLTTVFLIYYFHTSLQPSLVRYATIVVLLFVGSVYLQASIIAPQNTSGDDFSRISENNLNFPEYKSATGIFVPVPVLQDNAPYILSLPEKSPTVARTPP